MIRYSFSIIRSLVSNINILINTISYMEVSKVKELIIAGLTDPHVEVTDTTGTGDHFSAVIISDDFNDLSLIKQHQLVYK